MIFCARCGCRLQGSYRASRNGETGRVLVAAVLPGVVLHRPRERWRRSLRKRTGRRLLDELAALPTQGQLALNPVTEPRRCEEAS